MTPCHIQWYDRYMTVIWQPMSYDCHIPVISLDPAQIVIWPSYDGHIPVINHFWGFQMWSFFCTGMYWYVPVCTVIHNSRKVRTGMYYRYVHTGTYRYVPVHTAINQVYRIPDVIWRRRFMSCHQDSRCETDTQADRHTDSDRHHRIKCPRAPSY